MKIAFFHLYNDYSGSPKVLRNVGEWLLNKGYNVSIVTSKTNGVLDELKCYDNVEYDYFHYHTSCNKFSWVLHFVWAQICLFIKAFRYKDYQVFYINTIMPIGAAIAGKLLGKRVVYHYHENAFIKSAFYRLLYKGMLRIADKIICVSHYQRSFLPKDMDIEVIHNALPSAFTSKLLPDPENGYKRKNILMVSSLLLYKSPIEFIHLATELSEYNFTLVLNETDDAINSFIKEHKIVIPQNLSIFPRQSNIHQFYNNASILLNLSNPNKVIETFGMTALEGMSAALPVIVPTVGGITEFVEDGVNGYKIDVQNIDEIASKIREMLSDAELYCKLSKAAIATASKFTSEQMCNCIEKTFLKS